MASLNKVMLIGRLGRDPESNFSSNSGSQVTKIAVATSRDVRNYETGAFEKQTDWHNVVAFGKTAETIAKYFQKGSSIYIEGYLRTNRWTDKDGNARTTIEVVANSIQFIDPKQSEPQTQQQNRPKPPQSQRKPTQSQGSRSTQQNQQGWKDGGSFDDIPEDCPF